MVTHNIFEQYQNQGYVIVRGLFSPEETTALREHFMKLREGNSFPGDFAGVPRILADVIKTNDSYRDDEPDPLKDYPRMIHMHRWDEISLHWLLEPRVRDVLASLLGTDPYAVQTMLYFKPPGARGQALHQDQYYLKVQPGTCIAAWMALDDCDEANGCMQMVSGSHTWDVLCTIKADTMQSFTDVTVPLPPGAEAVPQLMQAGDVLFFNGQVVHGSFPNTTTNRFRRSLIGHYIVGEAQKVAEFYHPVLQMDGTEVTLDVSEGGGSCGVWVERDGEAAIAMSGASNARADDRE
ncbi:MAG: phytanoyl-CoA dioxygenase family protein [Chloroflexota bacterium]